MVVSTTFVNKFASICVHVDDLTYISTLSFINSDRPSAQVHEVGHNLNFAHSNEGGATYEDQTGMMGYSYSQDEGPGEFQLFRRYDVLLDYEP